MPTVQEVNHVASDRGGGSRPGSARVDDLHEVFAWSPSGIPGSGGVDVKPLHVDSVSSTPIRPQSARHRTPSNMGSIGIRPMSARTPLGAHSILSISDTPRSLSARSGVSVGSARNSAHSHRAPRNRIVDGEQIFCDPFFGLRILDAQIVQEAVHRTAMSARALGIVSEKPMMSAFYQRKLEAEERRSVYGGSVRMPSTRAWRSSQRRLSLPSPSDFTRPY